MGRLQHQRSVRAPAGASDGNDITAGEGTRIGRHHRDFHGYLSALAEESERVGD